jgi:hypothetical protein
LIDRGIGLDEVLVGIDAQVVASERRHDAHRDRLPNVEWIADREHDVAHAQVLRAAKGDCRQIGKSDLEDRKIALRIGADQVCIDLAPVRKLDGNLFRGFDNMVVRQDITVGGGNDARAEVERTLIGVLAASKETIRDGIFTFAWPHLLGGVDTHHGAHRPTGRVGIRRGARCTVAGIGKGYLLDGDGAGNRSRNHRRRAAQPFGS